MLTLISIISIATSIFADQYFLHITSELKKIDQQIENYNLSIKKTTEEITKKLDCQNGYIPSVNERYATCQNDQSIFHYENEINVEQSKYLSDEWLNNLSYHTSYILERASIAYILIKTFIAKKNEHVSKQKNLAQVKEIFFSKKELLLYIDSLECDKDSYIFVYKIHPGSIQADIEAGCVQYHIEEEKPEQEMGEHNLSLDFLEVES